MALSAQEANARLATITTKEQLRDLINQLDISASGKTTILYSGVTADGISHAQIIQGMLRNGGDIRVIDQTEASKFLGWEVATPTFCRFGSFAIWIRAGAGKRRGPTLSAQIHPSDAARLRRCDGGMH
jgi:hypothetical protein